jgi:predicted metal-dependent phosphoesterase TrpH
MIDLHTHSTASDGTLAPRELVALAARSRLDALALTDHDTLAGLPEALAAGEELGLEVIPGCELSVGNGPRSMHLVGLWVRPGAPHLTQRLDFVRQGRDDRNVEIIARLRELGIDITLEEVAALAGGTVGRPHMARVLVNKGVVRDIEQAFRDYMGNQGAAYVPRRRLGAADALRALADDGATSILAHPGLLGLRPPDLERTLRELKDLGLDGLEVHYTEHDARTMDLLLHLANRLDLQVSGGSDFHGDVKPGIFLGRGKGSLVVPTRVLDDLKAYRLSRGLWT